MRKNQMLQCKLSDYTFSTYDYGRNITFRIYDETGVAFVATNYTGVVKVSDVNGTQMFTNLSVSWTAQATGVGTFAFTSSQTPYIDGFLWLEISLTQSGIEQSTEPVRIRVRRGPPA